MENTKTMENVIAAYITCALWASIDDNGDPLDDNYSCADIDEETLKTMRFQIVQFCHENADYLAEYMREYPADYIGHDFWLSRNGHGAGFFDRCKIDPELRDRLQEAARIWAEFCLYIGDDGKIHGYNCI